MITLGDHEELWDFLLFALGAGLGNGLRQEFNV
ncbi:hypothetical protein Ae150APs1_6165c [Pseudonocardia sp. Ae150A_Ps1]|nr:hypothetical protein Ae150APs1_6165c [Pseudonocardia sp. Ae150A_Ps1]